LQNLPSFTLAQEVICVVKCIYVNILNISHEILTYFILPLNTYSIFWDDKDKRQCIKPDCKKVTAYCLFEGSVLWGFGQVVG